jgi:hypothetical protein
VVIYKRNELAVKIAGLGAEERIDDALMDLRAEKIALDLEHLGCDLDYMEEKYHRIKQDVVQLKNEKSQRPTALPTLEDVEDKSIAIVRQNDEDYE